MSVMAASRCVQSDENRSSAGPPPNVCECGGGGVSVRVCGCECVGVSVRVCVCVGRYDIIIVHTALTTVVLNVHVNV